MGTGQETSVSGYTVGKAFHWAASIYICIWAGVVVLLVAGSLVWAVVAAIRHIMDWWQWALALLFIVFSLLASHKVCEDGMAWEREAQSDETGVAK